MTSGAVGYVFYGVLILGAAVYALRTLGIIPEPGQAAERYKIEAESANRELLKKEAELKLARSEAVTLAKTRTLEPIIELLRQQGEQQTQVLVLLQQSSEAQAQVVDRLASFNGTLKRTNESLTETRKGLRHAADGLKALTGTIAELHGLPLSDPTTK